MDAKDPVFLGFGAFETTAFLTAVLVACYSLIPNPTGRQSSTDQAEYAVYSGWRFALITIILQLILMLIVIIQQATEDDVPTRAKGWLLALMVAPWAPLAGKVRDTVTSGGRVRRMMRSRVTRNEIAAIMRDRFKFGQRGIALPSIIHHATHALPEHPAAALLANPVLAPHIGRLREQATAVAQTEEPHALDLGSLWVMNQSLQPSSISRRRLFFWRLISIFDILGRVWTTRAVQLAVDPMPEVTRIMERARYLDVADHLQQGGTISDELMDRGMKHFCQRCRLATRGAVESFLESSERGHTDLRSRKWLRNIGMNWRGNFERVMDVMWEAAFMDAKAARVEYDEKDASPDYGDRPKITTTKTLALLFLIIRSLMRTGMESETYEIVASIVRDGPYRREWWDRYWQRLTDRLCKGGAMEKIDERTRAEFKATLRDIIDEDMCAIVNELVKHPIDDSLCSEEDCFLHRARLVPQEYV